METKERQFFRRLFIWAIMLAIKVWFPGVAQATVRYSIAQISPASYECRVYDINNEGMLAGGYYDGRDTEIIMYRDGAFDQLTAGDFNDTDPRLNNAGMAVWTNYTDIFYYNPGTDEVTNITANTDPLKRAGSPQLNDRGSIVWSASDSVGGGDVYLYQKGITKNLSVSNPKQDQFPQINNLDQVVWQGWDGKDYEIYLWDKGVVKKLTNNDRDDYAPQINDKGSVVWSGYDSIGKDQDIFFYDGLKTRNISVENSVDEWNPQINYKNQVVWEGRSRITAMADIFLWDTNNVKNLSNTSRNDENPVINNLGMVAWDGDDGQNREIYLYYQTKIQITKTYSYNNHNPLLNDRGQIAWSAYGTFKAGIFLASPKADTYTFTYTYGSGKDSYSGTVYAHPLVEYYPGYRFAKKNETGDTGYYEITGMDYTGDYSLYGQVYVDKYYDAESKKTFVPVHKGQAVGTNHLGSELDYLGVDGAADYKFGKGYYEADVCDTYTFRYTYGNGDYYDGVVYRAPAQLYYKGWKLSKTNELGLTGSYEILTAAYTGKSTEYYKVFVTNYYDGESKTPFSPVHKGQAVGTYLGNEVDYLGVNGVSAYQFGKGYYEADVCDTYTFRYTYGNGDWYEGTVYQAPTEGYYQGWKLTKTNELSLTGYYSITKMAYTCKTAEYKKVYVTKYYDGETKTSLPMVTPATGYFGDKLLESEWGYVISATSTHYFGKGYYEADK